jgi:hypothetical protein
MHIVHSIALAIVARTVPTFNPPTDRPAGRATSLVASDDADEEVTMLVLSAFVVPCGLLVLMMAMQQVQERLLPSAGPEARAMEAPAMDAPAVDAVADTTGTGAATGPTSAPVVVVIPAQTVYESSVSPVGSASLTSASPSR